MIELINRYEKKVSDLQYILSVVALGVLINFLISPVAKLLEKLFGSLNGPQIDSIFMSVMVCTIGPLIESCIVVWIISFFQKRIRKKSLVLLITTIIFSLLHYYSVTYIIIVFPAALLQVYSYMYYEGKRMSPFKVMLLIHMLQNCIAVLEQFII